MSDFEKFFTRPETVIVSRGHSAWGDLKHGDWSKDKKKRFWAYHSPTGKEGWISAERFSAIKKKQRVSVPKLATK